MIECRNFLLSVNGPGKSDNSERPLAFYSFKCYRFPPYKYKCGEVSCFCSKLLYRRRLTVQLSAGPAGITAESICEINEEMLSSLRMVEDI